MLLLLALAAASAAQPILQNGNFEAATVLPAAPTADIGFGVWTVADHLRVPAAWQMNSAYPGGLAMLTEGAHGGQSSVRIEANGQRGVAHLFQPCPGLEVGKCYRVSVWFRGGQASIGFYEYREDGAISVPTLITSPGTPEGWREAIGYYVPAGADFRTASVAIVVAKGETVDVDDVNIEAVGDATPEGLEPVVLETGTFRLRVSPDGKLEEFISRETGKDYAVDPPAPVFRISRNGGEMPVRYVKRDGDLLEVHFLEPDLTASFTVETRPRYLLVSLESVSGAGVDWVQLCDLRLDISENVGTLINAAWDDTFAACVLACNQQTHSYGASGARAALVARCYREYGVEGGRIAIVGALLEPPGSTDRLLDAIQEVELAEGLPHPEISGVWIKRAPERFASYLMAGGASEANIDQVIEFAKGGFGCVELLSWWDSTPSYAISPRTFPSGPAGLKECADKIHAAGLQVGLHCMQGMVGWGGVGMKDPYVSPKADPRLLQDRHVTLASTVAPDTAELPVAEDTSDWPEKGDLFIDGELVRYGQRTEGGFAQCQRGLHGTEVREHAAGTKVGHLVNCFSMWDHVIYAPDVNSTMIDEICDNIAEVFSATGADMTYFDGGEEVAVQPPHWYNQGRIALGVLSRLGKPVVLEGNALYTHHSWHVISRGSPSYDPIYYGRRDYTLRAKGQNPARWAKNLLTGDVGWFAAHVYSPSTDAVTPDEVMLLCLKAVGGKAPISFQINCNDLWANKRMPEMLAIIRTCDEIKRRDYFSAEVCKALAEPFAEHVLEATAEGGLVVRPLTFGPPRVVDAGRMATNEWAWENPHADQGPWVRIRARTRLAEYGAEENIVLADFADGVPFQPDGTASADLTQSVDPSPEKTPNGSSAFCYRAHNGATSRSGWCCLSSALPQVIDLSEHRRLALWVRAEGKGGILNVQLADRHGFRDHYIALDYTGWKYHELDPPEAERFWDYQWPYSFVDLMYWHFQYSSVKGINLLYNDLPPGTEVACLVGRIEALREYENPVVSPALELGGQKLAFPVALQPTEYLELDWDGVCRHFERNGGLLGDVRPQGALRLAKGANQVRFTCGGGENTSTRAEVTLATRGEAPPDERPHPPLRSSIGPGDADERVHLPPDGKGGLRFMKGLYELAGGTPRAIPAFDGAANVWTVTNEQLTPQQAAVLIARVGDVPDVDYDDPDALSLETFDDLSPYEMSETNQFEKYVIGGGKQLTEGGPVRTGVTQTFETSRAAARPGSSCGVYTATNEGGPGGWCAKGRRFAPPVDLSAHEAVAFWLYGDGKGEKLRFQFRDVTGAYADWVLPIDFIGWRLQVLRTGDRPDFDWGKVEYVIFYFNDIPAKSTVTLKLDGLKVMPRLRQPPPFVRPVLTVNGEPLALGTGLEAAEALTIDETGECMLWRAGRRKPRRVRIRSQGIVLKPGENRFELTCDTSKGTPRDVTIRVVPLGPT